MNKFKVVEKFVSINGESRKSGELAVFIRLAHCNLICSYCDTMWANEINTSYTLMSSDEIYNYLKSVKVKNVTLTGGEPLITKGIFELIEKITSDKELFLEVETNGSVDISKFFIGDLENLSFTVDYKSPSSLMEDKMNLLNLKNIRKQDAYKFVVGTQKDLLKAKDIIIKYNLVDSCKIYLSSIYNEIDLNEIVEFMKEFNLNGVKLQLQAHKFIWDSEKKGV